VVADARFMPLAAFTLDSHQGVIAIDNADLRS
jgi:hypothetical protein